MPREIITTGRIDKGHIHIRNRRMFRQAIAGLRDGEVEVIVRRKHAIRSLRANAYFWGVVMRALSDHTGYTPDEMHEYCKSRFLPAEHRTTMAINGKGGEIVAEFTTNGSTRRLTTLEFYEYVRDIKVWASADLGIYIPDPNEG